MGTRHLYLILTGPSFAVLTSKEHPQGRRWFSISKNTFRTLLLVYGVTQNLMLLFTDASNRLWRRLFFPRDNLNSFCSLYGLRMELIFASQIV